MKKNKQFIWLSLMWDTVGSMHMLWHISTIKTKNKFYYTEYGKILLDSTWLDLAWELSGNKQFKKENIK